MPLRLLLLLASLGALACLCACKPKTVVGTWNVTGLQQGIKQDVKVTFKPDKTMSLVADVSLADIPQAASMGLNKGKIHLTGTGTYTFEKDVLTFTIADTDVKSEGVEGPLKGLVESPLGKEAVKNQLSKTQTIEIVWNDDGSFTAKENPNMVFKRA